MTPLIAAACALCGFYLEGSVMAVRELPPPPPPYVYRRFDRTEYANPYGAVAIGYEWWPKPDVRYFVEIRHESALGTTADTGEDSVRAGFRWFFMRRDWR